MKTQSQVDRTLAMELLERHHGVSIEEILIGAYEEYGGMPNAAKALGVSLATLDRWMNRLGIETSREITYTAHRPKPRSSPTLIPRDN